MLNSKDIIKKMLNHFPRWMDIRKRANKSKGGLLIEAVAEGLTEEIQSAIDDYVNDFFIGNYEGREDSIVAFIYKTQIGLVNIEELALTKPQLEVTTDLEEFYSSSNYAFYENGMLYFRTESIQNDKLPVEYSIGVYKTTGFLTKMHVWNVFDEFATFMGIQRYEWETNAELMKRTLAMSRGVTNKSEQGLKNIIKNALINIDPDLIPEEIYISRPSPENLVKYYQEFETIIEKMAMVNRDVYRTKRWDLDNWKYEFKSVDYLPHAWDIAIETFQNGIGAGDDLQVVLADSDSTTDATITFYEESEAIVQEYVKNRDIRKNVKFKLSKYNNALKTLNVRYKITASEIKDITDSSIELECFEKLQGEHTRLIQDIISDEAEALRDVIVVNNNELEPGKNYKLVFTPVADYGVFNVNKCSVTNMTEDNVEVNTTNLLTAKPGFVLQQNGSVVSDRTRLFVSQKGQFSETLNAISTQDGIEIDNKTQEAVLSLSLIGMASQHFIMDYESKMTPLPSTEMKIEGFFSNENNEYITDTSKEERHITISKMANQISFKIKNGSYGIQTVINGQVENKFGIGEFEYSTPRFDTPQEMTIVIMSTAMSGMTVGNIRYSHYEISKRLSVGSFVKLPNGEVLPDINNNSVYITMRTYTGHSPIVKYVYIGDSLAGAKYETDIITYVPGQKRIVNISTGSRIELQEVDANGNVVKSTPNYSTNKVYKALSDQAYIKLNMSKYTNIKSLQTYTGRFETLGTGSNTEYYIRLKKDDELTWIIIDGERLLTARQITLHELLNVNPANGDKIYANSLLKGLIVVKNNKEELVTITRAMVSSNLAEGFKFKNLPEGISSAFVISTLNNSVSVTDTLIGQFEKAYLFPNNSNNYIAFNETKMIKAEQDNIEIVDVFYPDIDANDNMVYKVEPMTNLGYARFQEDPAFYMGNGWDWALGHKKLIVRADIDMNNSENYDLELKNIEQEFSISSAITFDKHFVMPTGEIVELAQYMITVPAGMSVIYNNPPIDITLNNMENYPDYVKSESFIAEEDGFNKLKYSNIHDIMYIGTVPYRSGLSSDISAEDFVLKKQEGLIIWDNDVITDDSKRIYIIYTIKLPAYISIAASEMYKLIEYSLDAYREVQIINLESQADGSVFDLTTVAAYKNNSRMTVMCSKPGFEAKLEDDKLIFKRSYSNDMVAVTTGYYYFDGDEYYLFSNETLDTVDKFKNVEFYNVQREDSEMNLNKRSRNYIRNSYMELSSVSDIFSLDFMNRDILSGISKLNSITACDSFNHWRTFGCNLNLLQGLNGMGIMFKPTIVNGYAFLDITEYLLPNSHISFYAQGDVKVYIGKEKKIEGLSFNKSTSIELDREILATQIEANIRECNLIPEPNTRYYLVAKNSGVIDDIILQDGSKTVVRGFHKKNINYLNIAVEEQILDDYVARLYLDDNRGSQLNGAEVNKEGYIINSSMIDWGITKIKEFNDTASWSRCFLNKVHVQDGIVKTTLRKSGTIETEPVYIGDIRTVKNLIFKINDVLFDNMSGFATKIMISNSYNGIYRDASSYKDNLGFIQGKYLQPYVKLSVEVPVDKLIKNISIYVEYKTTPEAAPVEVLVQNGIFQSRVLDAQYASNYKVKGIDIESVSNISDVAIQVRAAREGYEGELWMPWKDIVLDNNMKITNKIEFENCRFFQAKVTLKNKSAFVKLKHIDLEVVR